MPIQKLADFQSGMSWEGDPRHQEKKETESVHGFGLILKIF